ncbi:hypothetical protein [Amycolatopsis sp. WQ 127309]|uniref:hypothetical protein n=1 Tax=Amycolatopsis sp. WQ 127309 TaxID=2932773 RepID=UPI001FF57B78|nr:hypothetical protein [Amycolatopsis sp. WQ 127309]UOZ06989.1 hypothetical protein MUY22_01455 [Amycolatopsis sp. WQ 127309]
MTSLVDVVAAGDDAMARLPQRAGFLDGSTRCSTRGVRIGGSSDEEPGARRSVLTMTNLRPRRAGRAQHLLRCALLPVVFVAGVLLVIGILRGSGYWIVTGIVGGCIALVPAVVTRVREAAGRIDRIVRDELSR